MMERRITGWHVAAMMVAFFGVIVAVNVTMARIAVGSFGGVVVENSYVASQEFNGWLAQAEAQQALGWDFAAVRSEEGAVEIAVTGAPDVLVVTADARHPFGREPGKTLTFHPVGSGHYVANEELAPGRWILRLHAVSSDTEWRGEAEIR